MEKVATEQSGVLRVLQSKSETRAFYNKIATVYDLLSERSEAPIRRAALEALGVKPGEEILEIGFGTGHTLVKLARAAGPAGKVYGIDLADEMVRIARRNVRREGLSGRVEARRGDAARLPYRAEAFDAIFMSFTLELFDTPEIPKVLAECRRVLRPGGRLAVASLSKEGKGGPVLRAFEWTHRHFPNFLDCRPIFVRRAVEAAGFRILRAHRKSMWVPVEVVLARKPEASW